MDSAISGSLDANVLLRLLLNDIPDQHKAVLELFHDSSKQFAVADTAIAEVAFVLERHYEFTREQISEAIIGLTNLVEISCNRTLFEKSLVLFTKHPSLSFEDCCLATYVELNNATPLWTFDQKLANQAPSALLVPAR